MKSAECCVAACVYKAHLACQMCPAAHFAHATKLLDASTSTDGLMPACVQLIAMRLASALQQWDLYQSTFLHELSSAINSRNI